MAETTAPVEKSAATGARSALVALGLLLLAAGLRGAAARGDLWLDEIWTLWLLWPQELWPEGPPRVGVSSLAQVFTLHEENNHYLNTLALWLAGLDAPAWAYRLPAVAAGAGSVALAGLIGRRRSPAAGALAMLLTGTSYLLVHYSSEARGYAYAVCCALACVEFEERLLRGGSWRVAAALCAAALAGVLSQPVFLSFYGALVVWSAWRVWQSGGRRRSPGRMWWAARLPPLALFAVLWVLDISLMYNAGGPVYPLADVLVQTLSLTAGGPDRGTGALVAALGAAAGLVGALALLWRSDRAWCVLAVLAIVVFPAALLVAAGRQEVYPRYFVIPVALICVTWGLGLARCAQNGAAGRAAAIALAIGVVALNGAQVARLIRLGRGSYSAAVDLIASESSDRRITVGSDHDFRNELVLAYYRRRLPAGRSLVYAQQRAWPPGGPEWLLRHALDAGTAPPPRQIFGPGRQPYDLKGTFPHAGLSGWTWAVYRQADWSPPRE